MTNEEIIAEMESAFAKLFAKAVNIKGNKLSGDTIWVDDTTTLMDGLIEVSEKALDKARAEGMLKPEKTQLKCSKCVKAVSYPINVL